MHVRVHRNKPEGLKMQSAVVPLRDGRLTSVSRAYHCATRRPAGGTEQAAEPLMPLETVDSASADTDRPYSPRCRDEGQPAETLASPLQRVCMIFPAALQDMLAPGRMRWTCSLSLLHSVARRHSVGHCCKGSWMRTSLLAWCFELNRSFFQPENGSHASIARECSR
jgi:hypothetical protein